MRSIIVFLLCLNVLDSFSQVTRSHIDFRVKNDDAGEISNWLHTGDDLGETQSLCITANLLKLSQIYNFRTKIESTEYSALNSLTPEPRDILFKEVNHIQFSFDNNKFKPDSFFFSGALGLYYIQSQKITIGATGQKYYWHKWLVNHFYSNKYWIYVPSADKSQIIPYMELKYGYNKLMFKKEHIKLMNITNLECRIASKFNYSGIGVKTYFDLSFSNERFKMHTIDLELEGYYLTNYMQYQIAYLQMGVRFNFKHLALYTHLNKPIKKYLDNPYTKYDDMELQFIYGLLFFF